MSGPYRKVIMRRRAPETVTTVLEGDVWVDRGWRYPLIEDILECYHSTTRYSGPDTVRRRCRECGPTCDCIVCRRQRNDHL